MWIWIEIHPMAWHVKSIEYAISSITNTLDFWFVLYASIPEPFLSFHFVLFFQMLPHFLNAHCSTSSTCRQHQKPFLQNEWTPTERVDMVIQKSLLNDSIKTQQSFFSSHSLCVCVPFLYHAYTPHFWTKTIASTSNGFFYSNW